MNDEVLRDELVIANIIKTLNIYTIRGLLYPNELDLLINTVKKHIILNVKMYKNAANVDELILSNMLDSLKLRFIRWSLAPEELECLINFVREHVTNSAEKLLESDNNKILKKQK